MHCKIKQKLSLNIFITIISIIHTKHVADLLKNLRTDKTKIVNLPINVNKSNLAFSLTSSPTLSLPHSITSSKVSAVASVIPFSMKYYLNVQFIFFHFITSGALLDGVVDEDLDVAVEHLLLVCVLLLSQGGAVAIQGRQVLLAATNQGGLHGGLIGAWSPHRLDCILETLLALVLSGRLRKKE